MKRLLFTLAAAASAHADVPPDHAEKMARGLDLFQKEVAPLLKQHCVKCHGGEKTKSDFDLATRDGLLKGGKEGIAIKPFSSAESPLMKLVRHEVEPEMPDGKPKLPDPVIAKFAAWIDLGAPYDAPLVAGKAAPRDRAVVSAEDRKWWSFQPLTKVTPPAGSANPIDAFLLKAAEAKKLAFSPPASPAKLARRLYLDLTGLPPTPEEIAAFENAAKADRPGAVKALVAKLLASPAYGERWARHWLDVARFAESSGFEHDYDRPNAYYYRDFVIRALNSDMPFDQFARWQLAGDEFAPENPEAMMATGFLGAGVFPTQITANEVERTRYDALDDMLSTTSSAFLGLTVGCARCHDHKFDPIPTADYYRLLSTFTTTVRSNVDLPLPPADFAQKKAKFDTEESRLQADLARYEGDGLRKKFDAWLATATAGLPGSAPALLEVSGITSQARTIFKKLDDGSWLATGANGETDTYIVTAKTPQRHLTGLKLEALADPSMPHQGPGRADNGNFALSRLRVSAQPIGGGPAKDVKLIAGDFTHQQNKTSLSLASSLDDDPHSGWAVDQGGIGKSQAAALKFAEPVDFAGGAQLTVTLEFAVNTRHNIGRLRLSGFADGEPTVKSDALPPAVLPVVAKLRAHSPISEAENTALFDWWKTRDPERKDLEKKIAEHAKSKPNPNSPVMVCAEGFTPIVMHSQGPPFLEKTHLLKRGDTNQKERIAEPGFLQVLSRTTDEKRWTWTPPAGAKYSGRRRSLANWLTDVDEGGGALMARVAVNRLWQHHFGHGLVSTPSDFGKTGTLPSNPELLDWLARELIRNGWRLKPIHELILASAAYQQSTAVDPAKLAADPDNALFTRRTPLRLEAEAARDAMLSVSGLLDPKMFGPGTLDENSRRRSVYFTVKRSQLVNSMVVLDAPEPLSSQGSRPTTTVAPQALLLMNSPQARDWARGFARRVLADVKSDDPSAQIARVFATALGRAPTPAEALETAAFVTSGADRTQALADLCQTILATNEFIYVP